MPVQILPRDRGTHGDTPYIPARYEHPDDITAQGFDRPFNTATFDLY